MLLGEEDKEKIKNLFSKLKKNNKIEREDKNAIKSKVRYKKISNQTISTYCPKQEKLAI